MGTNAVAKNWFEKFDHHKVLYSYLLFALYLLINNSINASSVWMEHSRSSNNTLQLWEPIVWEYSSAVSTLLLCPLLFWWFSRHPLQLSGIRRQLLLHLTGSLVFSVCHVAIMVGLRELIYYWQGGNYTKQPVSGPKVGVALQIMAGSAPVRMQAQWPTRAAAESAATPRTAASRPRR